jgi:hypothetical protein
MIEIQKYSFFSHPNSVCMSYLKHMSFSLLLATQFIWGASKAVIHAFFPGFYVRGSSDTVNTISNKLETSGCSWAMPDSPKI